MSCIGMRGAAAFMNVILMLLSLVCFQVGTVVDDPLEQNNLSKGQRRATLTEQLLVDAELTDTRKRRFNKLQVGIHQQPPSQVAFALGAKLNMHGYISTQSRCWAQVDTLAASGAIVC